MLEHRDAVLARLRAHPHLTVVDGPAGGTQAPPYVVVYVYTPDESRTKLEGDTDETWVTAVTHSVGASVHAAGIVARNVRQALLDQRLVVPGWKCDRITHDDGRAADWDESTGVRVMDAVDEWGYRAEPI